MSILIAHTQFDKSIFNGYIQLINSFINAHSRYTVENYIGFIHYLQNKMNGCNQSIYQIFNGYKRSN